MSPELAAAITDWPSEYHLSRSRHCLIRPLGIRSGERVLELGCGCGAITRYLGEIGARTVAVEGSLRRAQIAAERCRDLSHVQVIADDLTRFETEERFDWVLLIGVLEYAPVFSSCDCPAQDYLQAARRFLSPSGRLAIAIENKLGLKYFNGCSEDHLGRPNAGIQGLYGPKAPITFGRGELQGIIQKVGLEWVQFYYPFPDYKLPAVILSEAAFSHSGFNPVDLLARCHSRDYTGLQPRHFDEALVFAELGKNGLIPELSNSFLVVATAEPQAPRFPDMLAMTFAVDRLPELATQTRFERRGNRVEVTKEPLQEGLEAGRQNPGSDITLRLDRESYHRGRVLLWRVLAARAGNGGRDGVIAAFRSWFRFVLKHARVKVTAGSGACDLASFVVSGHFIDCTPFNLVDSGNALYWIDREWQQDSDIPLGWVVVRGVLHSLEAGAGHSGMSVFRLVAGLCAEVSLSVSAAEVRHWLSLESAFQTTVTGCDYGARHYWGGASDMPEGSWSTHLLPVGSRRRQIASLCCAPFLKPLRSAVAHLRHRLPAGRAGSTQKVASAEADLFSSVNFAGSR